MKEKIRPIYFEYNARRSFRKLLLSERCNDCYKNRIDVYFKTPFTVVPLGKV